MAVAGITPKASQLTRIDKMQSVGCRLCRIAQEARGESTDGLVVESYGHMNSAGWEGMVMTVTKARENGSGNGFLSRVRSVAKHECEP